MTVADNTSRNQYTATSGQTVFAYTFEIVDKDHIVVLQNGTALSEGTDYTVSNVGNDNGGNVTLTSGATAGDIMTLYRDMPYSRDQNYTNSGDFLASEVNSDFDNLWLAGEQTNRTVNSAIRKPITDSDSISMELPDAATRADKFLKFDATGAVDVAGATVSVSADAVTIEDAGNYYDSNDVEGALQEIGADLETKAPIDSPTFTGTVTIPSPFTLDSTSVTVSGTELNYLDGLTGNVQEQIDSVDVESIAHINEYINPPDGSGPVSDSVALTNACNAAEIILFGGTTMDIDADWSFPAGGIARRWMFQGNTWNLTNNAQITIDVDDFAIIGDGATVDGNWKIAQVNGETIDEPTTITVQSGHNFEAGDQIASSWSNTYLPNSTSRTGTLGEFNTVASKTDTTITLTHQVLSTLTVGGVGESIPGNAWLFNARFDKHGIGFTGAGRFHIEGVTFQNMPNAYAINVNDTTEAATASIIDCEINGIALDSMFFRGNALYMRNLKVRDLRDIAKQVLVWANETKPGYLYAENCDWAHSNQDGFLYAYTPETSKNFFPEMVWQNCVFDGINDDDFVPRQTYQQPCLNWASRNSTHHLIGGKATFVNCNFFNIVRHVLGTTYSGVDAITQDKMIFQNCNMDCEGAYFEIEGDDLNANGRSICEPLIYENCNLKATNFRLNTGLGEVYFSNTVIQQMGQTNIDYFYRGDEQEETSTTTTRDYYEGEFILNTASGLIYECTAGSGNSYEAPSGTLLTNTSYFTEKARVYYVESSATTTQDIERLAIVKVTTSNTYYQCIAGGSNNFEAPAGSLLTDDSLFARITTKIRSGHFENTRLIGDFEFERLSDVIFDNLRLPKRTGERVPVLRGLYQSAFDNKIIFEGVDASDATAIDPDDFFLNGTGFSDAPPIEVKIDGTDGILVYGGDTTSAREHHYRLINRQFDPTISGTAPTPVRGAFLVDPLETSLVEARAVRDQHHKITTTKSLDINASASSGATSVVVTNIDGGETFAVGDWISFNNDGDTDVYFKEVTAVTGSDPYTLTIDSGLDEAITTSTNSFLIKHVFTNVVLDNNGEVGIDLTVNGDITINDGSFEVRNDDQTNGATLNITNSFDGGGWTSGDVIGTINFKTEDGSTSEAIRGQIKVFDDNSGSTTYPAYNAMSFSTGRINSLTEQLRIDSDGNVGIGDSAPTEKLVVSRSGSNWAGVAPKAITTAFFHSGTTDDYSGSAITIAGGDNTQTAIYFSDEASNDVGALIYDNNFDSMQFSVNNNERMRIDSSGNLFVGKTSSGISVNGFETGDDGFTKITRSSATADVNTVLMLNRLNTDGSIVEFLRSNSTVGNIGTKNGDLTIYSSATDHGGVRFASTGMLPTDNTGALSDATEDIGQTDYRWKDLYLSGGLRGDTTFKNNAGTTEYARFDSSGRLGLGETNPAHEIHIKSDSPQIRLEDDGGTNTYGDVQYSGVSLNVISRGGASSYGAITFARTDGTDTFNTAQINAGGDYRFFDDTGTEGMRWDASTSRLGIGTNLPARALHVDDVMRLEPRASAPSSPAAGDIYFDSTLSKLRCYDGTAWNDLF